MASRGQLCAKSRKPSAPYVTLGERGVQLQQRALEKTELRGDLAVGQHLQRAPHEREHLIERCLLRCRGRALLAAILKRRELTRFCRR